MDIHKLLEILLSMVTPENIKEIIQLIEKLIELVEKCLPIA